METKPRIHTDYIIRCIHRITENGVANISHMNSELVTPDIARNHRIIWIKVRFREFWMEFNLRLSKFCHFVPSSVRHQSYVRRLNSASGWSRIQVIMIIKSIHSCHSIFAIFVIDDLEYQQQQSSWVHITSISQSLHGRCALSPDT
jgi:hypothetical protein